MAGQKFVTLVSGLYQEIQALVASVGAGSAGAIPALDATGKLDLTFMPTGIGPTSQVIVASEALSANAWVNVWNSSGTPKVRNADATAAGKEARGFVLASVTSGGNATVYFAGQANSGLSGLTAGPYFLSTTPGVATATPPSATGNVSQFLGVATSASVIEFAPLPSVVLA